MFDHVGQKIMKLAWAAFVLGSTIAVVAGIGMSDAGPTWIFIIVAGVFVSWLGALLLFGFGRLIENSDEQVRLQNITVKLLRQQNSRTQRTADNVFRSPEEEADPVLRNLQEQHSQGKLTDEQYQDMVYQHRMENSD